MSSIAVASVHSPSSLTGVQLDTVPDFKVHGAANVRLGRGDEARGGLGNADSLDEVPGPVLSPPKDRQGQRSPLLCKAASQPEGCGEEGGRALLAG